MAVLRFVKELYGTMFKIVTDADGRKIVLPTENEDEAASIVIPGTTKNWCPFPNCGSDKCLNNITGEFQVFPESFQSCDGELHIRYFDIATCCKKPKKDFIVAKSVDYSLKNKEKGKCSCCTSPNVEKIFDIEQIRESFFKSSKLEKYEWWVWGDYEEEGIMHAQLVGMTIDEINIFLLNDPWRCNHCKRVFGYELDKGKGRDLFHELVNEVRKRNLKTCLEKLDMEKKRVVVKDVLSNYKCPLCNNDKLSSQAFSDDNLGENYKVHYCHSGFTISTHKCKICQEYYFIVFDDYKDPFLDGDSSYSKRVLK